jgi:ATP-dependent DNA ligase
VRQEVPEKGCEVVEYHIYDIASCSPNTPFSQRANVLASLSFTAPLIPVKTVKVNNEDELMEWFDTFRNEGYEGCMARNSNGLYVNKRSYDLQKLKEFETEEFEIIGIEEGRGKLAGHAIFVCRIKDQEFKAKMKGDTAMLKRYFEDHSLWKGKKLTVKYQGYTAYGIPRFPVGIAIRDYE